MKLIGLAVGSLPDAAWLRRQLTLDADAVHDAGHAARMLLKTPGFTAVALVVFAVGIGATTAIVSLADALLVRRCPCPTADGSSRSGNPTEKRVRPRKTSPLPTRLTG